MFSKSSLFFTCAIIALVTLIPASAMTLQKGVWKTAAWTYYTSYAPCCKNSPNYNPNAPKGECQDFSACKYLGDFAAIGHKSYDWVKSHDIIAFYDDSDPNGKNFMSNYGGKWVKIRKNGKEITAQIADTCGNGDCNGCCRKNSRNGLLVDMEENTVRRHFGSTGAVGGTIEIQLL